jgi:hypothetical protein
MTIDAFLIQDYIKIPFFIVSDNYAIWQFDVKLEGNILTGRILQDETYLLRPTLSNGDMIHNQIICGCPAHKSEQDKHKDDLTAFHFA